MSCAGLTADYAILDERWLRGLTDLQLQDETANRAVQVAVSFRRAMSGLTPMPEHDECKCALDRAQEECERRGMGEAFRAACKREDLS